MLGCIWTIKALFDVVCIWEIRWVDFELVNPHRELKVEFLKVKNISLF